MIYWICCANRKYNVNCSLRILFLVCVQGPLAMSLVVNPIRKSVFHSVDDTWRRQRHTLTPTFSAAKLKVMAPFIRRCCSNLTEAIEIVAKEGKSLDVKRWKKISVYICFCIWISIFLLIFWCSTWWHQRQTLTSTFCVAKLKIMASFIRRCCSNLTEAIEDVAKDISKTLGLYESGL